MTTFTSDDREEAYKKIVEAAPNQPGYEDAVPIPPTNQKAQAERNNEPVAWMNIHGQFNKKETWLFPIPLYTHPVKELTDEVWNKAFDFYCETDEGVLKFDFELRDEWKKEQLIRWKEAIRKASEK